MKKILLLTLIIGLMTCLAGQSLAHVSPRDEHRVLVIGTNSNSAFPGTAGSGYHGHSLVWLLNRLGFKVTMWTNTSGSFGATEQALVGLSTYDGIFLTDVHLQNHLALINDLKNAVLPLETPTYMIAKGPANGSLGSHGPSNFVNGALQYDQYWPAGTADCPLSVAHLTEADTVFIHGYISDGNLRFQYVPDESLLTASGLATRLIWKKDEPESTLVWRWNNIVFSGAASPPIGSFLIVSQFIRDAGYEKYKDYTPISFYLHLDADGMDSSPYCGADAARWEKIASEYREAGLSYFYFGPWEDGFEGTNCDEFASAWPNIDDVFTLTVHGPDNSRSATREWSDLTGGDEQEAFTTSFTNFATEMTPSPDSTLGLVTVHRAGWSLTNAKFWARKGLKVLNSMSYSPPNSANYIQNANTCKHMRFKPFSPEGADTTDWIRIIAGKNLIGDDPETYDEFYDNDSPGTRATTCGYYLSVMATRLLYGEGFYQHMVSVSNSNVIGECLLDGVVVPFIKSCENLFLLDNTPEKIRRYATEVPIGDGL